MCVQDRPVGVADGSARKRVCGGRRVDLGCTRCVSTRHVGLVAAYQARNVHLRHPSFEWVAKDERATDAQPMYLAKCMGW